MSTVKLKMGREKSARNYHPWLFSGAIAAVEDNPSPGEIVSIVDSGNVFLAYGYYNPRPQISIRLLEWDESKAIDYSWWKDKLHKSINRREKLARDAGTDSYRLVYSEGDGLPGLIVDKYADYLVLQSLTAGIERVKGNIIDILAELIMPRCIYERSEDRTRKLEGLDTTTGALWGEKPAGFITIKENDLRFHVDIENGQKTGFYLDQRRNRFQVANYAKDLSILDCFSHTGAFSIYALRAGAKSVTLIDSSRECLDLARRNIELNGQDTVDVEFVTGDAFELLRSYKDRGRKFDMIIIDPPKFARSQRNLKRALAGYKDINMLGMSLVNSGGYLATFSCSGAVDYNTFRTVLFWAAADSAKQVQIVDDLYQASCHPRLATFPEGSYLTGFLCRIE